MKRGPPAYGDANANPYAASQMQHMSAQRMQQNSSGSNFQDRAEFRAEEERKYTSAEGQWQWDRDAQQMSPHLYSDGQGGNSSKSFYSSQIPDAKSGPNQESRVHRNEQDMELGYQDNPPPQTLESLEQKFREDIVKLTKEHVDAEDAENARHKEKIIEINNQYQDQLSTLRTRHATRREEILHKESQVRLQQYQVVGTNQYRNSSGQSDVVIQTHSGGYGGPVTGDPQRQYGSGQFDSYRHRPESFVRGRMQGAEIRAPAPGGDRVYNTGPRYY